MILQIAAFSILLLAVSGVDNIIASALDFTFAMLPT
jgi:hypothetical protein